MSDLAPERQLEELEYQLKKEQRKRIKLEQALLVTQAELEMERRERRRLQRELLARDGRAERLLSVRRPFDYLRLLWWIVARPDVLKAYQADLDYREADALLRQGSWLVSSLLWLPVLGLLTVPWVTGALELSLSSWALLMVSVVAVWLLTGILGIHDNALSALTAVFATTVVTLCVTAIVTFFVSENIQIMILAGTTALLAITIGIAVSKVVKLNVANVVSHVVAIVVGGGVIIFMVDHVDRLLDAVAVMLVAVVIIPVVEERYRKAI